jgi:ATP-dependent helicase HrpA
VHRAILAGLLSQIGILDERNLAKGPPAKGGQKDRSGASRDRGARGIRFSLFPGSALRKKAPARRHGGGDRGDVAHVRAHGGRDRPGVGRSTGGRPRQAADLRAALVEGVGRRRRVREGDAVRRRDRGPSAGAVRAHRPARGAQLFLRHALVEGEWDPSRIDKRVSAFWRSNAELRKRLEKLEERERRRDILVGDEAVFRFYDERIPTDVFDVRSFEAWWRDALTTTPKLLVMREGDLIDDAERADKQDFPTRWTQADQVLGLAYRFEPGAADDGVSVVIPLRCCSRCRTRASTGRCRGCAPNS